jgi:hypothetical protein
MKATVSPRQPTVIARKSHTHGPHPEGDPTVGLKSAHTSVNERNSGASLSPCCETLVISAAEPAHEWMKVFELNCGLRFKFLNEVAMPMQAILKGSDASSLLMATALNHFTQG